MVPLVSTKDELVAIVEVRRYKRTECVAFRSTAERFGGLSNMAPGYGLRINAIEIRTSEALYQSCRFPHLPDVQRMIIQEASPVTAKMKSKPYREHSRTDWDRARVPVMRWCLRIKLAQNWSRFGDLLIQTEEAPIVEESSKDDFWGAIAQPGGFLVGRNVLGRLLMELRQLLVKDPSGLGSVAPPHLPNFLLYEQRVEAIERSPQIAITV